MLEIHEHMHNVWKNQIEEKSFQSGVFNWIDNLTFDRRVKEWLVGEERYKEEAQMKHILPAVADKFLVDRQADQRGASILCFDEIQVYMELHHLCSDLFFLNKTRTQKHAFYAVLSMES